MRLIRVLKRAITFRELKAPETEEEKRIIREHGTIITRTRILSGPGERETHEAKGKPAWNSESDLPLSTTVYMRED
jgi:hypothetical protein